MRQLLLCTPAHLVPDGPAALAQMGCEMRMRTGEGPQIEGGRARGWSARNVGEGRPVRPICEVLGPRSLSAWPARARPRHRARRLARAPPNRAGFTGLRRAAPGVGPPCRSASAHHLLHPIPQGPSPRPRSGKSRLSCSASWPRKKKDSMRLSLWLGLRLSLGPHSRPPPKAAAVTPPPRASPPPGMAGGR